MTSTKVILALSSLIVARAVLLQEDVAAVSESKEKQINYRLPSNVKPFHYDIYLMPYMTKNNFTFDGGILIDLEILSATQDIILHTMELEVDEDFTTLLRASDAGTETNLPASHSYNDDTQMLTLHFGESLYPGIYTLSMKFTGILNDDWMGFYRSPYIDGNGTRRWMAASHFEPTVARRAFPCFDEPALKATFNISIQHDSEYIALSNMPVSQRSPADEGSDKIWTHFEASPRMSTYSVAFVVGDLVNISSPDGMTNVWTRRGVIEKASHILDVATVATRALEEYTNSSFRVPKMDHVAVAKFHPGAMENWGLIIYSESSLLYDTSQKILEKIEVAQTAVHELAHQWFGNVVSPSWWSYVWLNEAFATYFEVYILDKITDMNWMEYFVVTRQHHILQLDSTNHTKPITVNVESAEDAFSAFSSIIYTKGASVLRMLSHILTENVFRKGLIKYLDTYQYKTASPSDLWSSIQTVLDESNVSDAEFAVAEAMSTWTDQRGYPAVTVHRDYGSGKATLVQTIFRPHYCPENGELIEKKIEETTDQTGNANKEESKWWIPISYTTQAEPNFLNTRPTVWMKPDVNYTSIEGIKESDWIIVNLQETGFYRVNYDTTNWRKIAKYLNSDNYTNIHPLNRAQILDDAFAFLRDCQLDPLIYMELTNYLSREGDLIPWIPVFRVFKFFEPYILHPIGANVFTPHVLHLMKTLIESVGFEEYPDDNDIVKTQRRHVIKWACLFGNAECRRVTAEKTFAYLEDPDMNDIPHDSKGVVICEGLRSANESAWSKLIDIVYAKETKQRRILFYMVACVRNDLIIKTHMNAISAENLKLHEKFLLKNMTMALSRNVAATDVILDHVIENCNKLEGMKNNSDITKLVTKVISKNLNNMEQLNKAKRLIKSCDIVYDGDDLNTVEMKITKIERQISKFLCNFQETSTERSSSQQSTVATEMKTVQSSLY